MEATTTVHAVCNEDLYQVVLNESGSIISAYVSRGNSCKPWQDVDLKDLPEEVIEKVRTNQVSSPPRSRLLS